jgi:hypothetical protein
MHKKVKFLIFSMIIVAGGASAQQKQLQLFNIQYLTKKYTPQHTTPTPFIQPNFYAIGLGAVCRQEIKWDKKLPVNFRFRLGSVEQCNAYERKK